MRFTLMMGLGGFEDYLAIATAAQSAGWTTISMPDSIFFPQSTASEYPYNDTETVRQVLDGMPVIEPFVAMASMAAVTDTLRFCPGVLKVPVRQPLILAKSLGSIAAVSNNRVSLGVGISPWKEDFIYNGVSWEGRGKRLDECIEIIRGAMTGDYFGPMKMAPVPEQPVPIIVGGHAKPALRRAARLGDGWMSANADFDTLRRLVEQLQAFRREYGTDKREDFEIQVMDTTAQTVDDYRRLEALGVTEALATPWDAYDARIDIQSKLDGIKRFADEFIAPLS
jgi:alkanesulfonate monooxygenase SsuD/methylene tetrahydromethanopterin reductase-like flavin-dependent oxidoreductase (luciferase family)